MTATLLYPQPIRLLSKFSVIEVAERTKRLL
jgi:hypothetical protein